MRVGLETLPQTISIGGAAGEALSLAGIRFSTRPHDARRARRYSARRTFEASERELADYEVVEDRKVMAETRGSAQEPDFHNSVVNE
jgi:hypothetical protein